MKRPLAALSMSAVVTFFCLLASSASAEEVVQSSACCNADKTIMCIMGVWLPIGEDCYCWRQTWGVVCI
jgi:hypothetical protein